MNGVSIAGWIILALGWITLFLNYITDTTAIELKLVPLMFFVLSIILFIIGGKIDNDIEKSRYRYR